MVRCGLFAAIAIAFALAVHDAIGAPSGLTGATYAWFDRAYAMGHMAVLIIAAILAWKKAGDPASLALIGGLAGTASNVLWAFGYPLGPWFWTAIVVDYGGSAVGLFLLLRFSALYAGGGATGASRIVARIAPFVAVWTGVFGFLVPALGFGSITLSDETFVRLAFWFDEAYWFGIVAGMLGILAAAVAQFRTAPEALRQRRLLILLGVGVYAATGLVQAVLRIVTQTDSSASNAVSAAGLTFMAVALTYALLTKQLLDIELIVDRAVGLAIAAIVLSALVYCAEEFLAPPIIKSIEKMGNVEEHGKNIELWVELGLGFVFFLFMHRVYDTALEFVERFSTASRDRGLRLVRDFQERIVLFSDDAAIESGLVHMLVAMGARSARFYLAHDGRSKLVRTAGDLSPEHAASIGHATVHVLEQRREATAVPNAGGAASLLLPMILRGVLYGFIELGPKRAGTAYGRDEIEALTDAVREAGLAHRALAR